MFSLNDIGYNNKIFSYGVYSNEYPDKINGMSVAVMQSAENADKVISDFEEAIARGVNPNNVIEEVLSRRGLTESDFTNSDILRINRRVEAIYKAMNNSNYNRGH